MEWLSLEIVLGIDNIIFIPFFRGSSPKISNPELALSVSVWHS